MKGRLLGKFGNKIRGRLKPALDKGKRRLKPRLHKRSLPPQTEEANAILTALSLTHLRGFCLCRRGFNRPV
jgi:hypothetical protein